jgi:hypothetical protein
LRQIRNLHVARRTVDLQSQQRSRTVLDDDVAAGRRPKLHVGGQEFCGKSDGKQRPGQRNSDRPPGESIFGCRTGYPMQACRIVAAHLFAPSASLLRRAAGCPRSAKRASNIINVANATSIELPSVGAGFTTFPITDGGGPGQAAFDGGFTTNFTLPCIVPVTDNLPEYRIVPMP